MVGAGAGLLLPAHRLELFMLACSGAGGYAGVACLLAACPQAVMVCRPLQPACQTDIRPVSLHRVPCRMSCPACASGHKRLTSQ